MKICSVCNHAQEEGKFCGKCGAPFTAVETDQAQSETVATTEASVQPHPVHPSAATQQPTEPNEQIEKLKTESKMFFSFFMQQLKSPSAHFNAVNSSAKNSLISIILYVLLTALAVYALIRSVVGSSLSYFGPSFIQIIFYFTLFAVILLAINVTAIFVTSKLFSENLSYTEVVRRVGGFFALPILFSVVGILLALIESYGLSTSVLYIGGLLAFGTIPVYIMVKLLAQKTKSMDGFYAFLFYFVITAALSIVLVMLVADSAIGDLFDYISYF